MKIFFILLVSFQLFSQQEEKVVNGIVTTSTGLLKSASILVKGTNNGVLTNKKGKYSIRVKVNDTLVFSHIGMQLVEIRVKSDMQILDIELQLKTEKLDEVVLKKRRAKTQKELLAEYPKNKKLIKTSWGIIDKDRASFSMKIIDGKDLVPIGRDFLSSLQNFFPQMKVDRTIIPGHLIDQPRVYLQNWGVKNTALFDVDGVLYKQTPTFVDVHDIERISILVRNGAISKYGTDGIGGVIIINTKSNTWMEDMAVKRKYDNSKLRDSILQILNKLPQK